MLQVVFFHDNKKVNAGYLIKEEDRHVMVELSDERELTISKNRIITTVQLNSTNKFDLSEIMNRSDEIDLEELWEVVSGISDEISFNEITELKFGNASFRDKLTMVYAICKDKIYFEINNDLVKPRTREQVLQRKIQAAKEQAEKERAQKWITWLDSDSKELSDLSTEEFSKLVAFALDESFKDSLIDRIKTILNVKGETLRAKILRRLKEKTIITDLTNLPLLKAGLSTEGLHLECSEQIFDKPCSVEEFIFSVDSENTKDIDDAICFYYSDREQYKLQIYVTNVASQIELSEKNLKKLLMRPTSVYLPDQTLHMLERSLAEDKFSLRSGQIRPVCVIDLTFDRQFKLKTWVVRFDYAKVAQNLTYDQFNDLLSDRMSVLKELTDSLKAQRVRDGAVEIVRDEVVVSVDPVRKKIILNRYPKTPAHECIEELMILANSIIAKYVIQNDQFCIFRTQQILDRKILQEALEIENPHVRNYKLRSALGKSEYSTRPAPHASLGLPYYTQATSPIRRFFDIVTQYQALTIFSKLVPLSEDQIKSLITNAIPHLETFHSVQKESKRFYILKYLLQENINELDGVIVNSIPNGYICDVPDFDMLCVARSSKSIKIGSQVKLRVDGIQPEKSSIHTSII